MSEPRPAVIVTGSAGGIGSALCNRFRDDGYFVVGVDRHPSPSADRSVELDMTRTDDLRQLGHDLAAERPIKAVVHNAAVQPLAAAGRTSLATWFEALQVNVISVDALADGTAENLSSNDGSIVVIGSVHGRATTGGITAYATTKAALEGWVRSAALDFGPHIRVNAVAPGAIDTPKLREGFARWGAEGADERRAVLRQRTALGRIGRPEDVADSVSFLIGDRASFITGIVLLVDGGASARLGSE